MKVFKETTISIIGDATVLDKFKDNKCIHKAILNGVDVIGGKYAYTIGFIFIVGSIEDLYNETRDIKLIHNNELYLLNSKWVDENLTFTFDRVANSVNN